MFSNMHQRWVWIMMYILIYSWFNLFILIKYILHEINIIKYPLPILRYFVTYRGISFQTQLHLSQWATRHISHHIFFLIYCHAALLRVVCVKCHSHKRLCSGMVFILTKWLLSYKKRDKWIASDIHPLMLIKPAACICCCRWWNQI